MRLEEILELLNNKTLNIKTNNCIITGVDNVSKTFLLENIQAQSIVSNSRKIEEEQVTIEYLTNIIVDLNVIEHFNILNVAFEKLNIEERIKLESIKDLLKFKEMLIKNKKAVQFIISNPSVLDEKCAQILNLLLWTNSYLFNVIILLGEEEHLSSYQIPNGNFLDNRENYLKIQLIK